MFQFPGFALKTLCVQVISTWFSRSLIAHAINDELSGGFPHSEIPGSKLILSSPGLIAEYHVLHRLLLPRHPPNALIALDLIRKKTNWSPSGQKQVSLFPLPSEEGNIWLVYLTWTTLPPGSLDPAGPPLGAGTATLMFISLYDVKSVRQDGQTLCQGLPVMSISRMGDFSCDASPRRPSRSRARARFTKNGPLDRF